jgi:hypothetical protein
MITTLECTREDIFHQDDLEFDERSMIFESQELGTVGSIAVCDDIQPRDRLDIERLGGTSVAQSLLQALLDDSVSW